MQAAFTGALRGFQWAEIKDGTDCSTTSDKKFAVCIPSMLAPPVSAADCSREALVPHRLFFTKTIARG